MSSCRVFCLSLAAFLPVRLQLLRSADGRQFDRLKTGNYASDQLFTDWSQFDIKPLFLMGGRLIGASLFSCSDWMLAEICHSEGLRLGRLGASQPAHSRSTHGSPATGDQHVLIKLKLNASRPLHQVWSETGQQRLFPARRTLTFMSEHEGHQQGLTAAAQSSPNVAKAFTSPAKAVKAPVNAVQLQYITSRLTVTHFIL